MAQDLRELFKEEKGKKQPMKKGHEERFLNRLDKELPIQKKSTFYFIKIAASILVLFSLGIYTYINFINEVPEPSAIVDKGTENKGSQEYSLGDLSPD